MCVADDNSPDKTADIADALGNDRVYVMRRTRDRGYGRAVNDGIRYGLQRQSDFIVTMDADFSHQPEVIPSMIDKAESGSRYDLVIGSRYASKKAAVKDWSLSRMVLSKVASAYVRMMVGVSIRDTTAGFRCWRGSFIARLPLDRIQASGYAYIYETLFHTNLLGGKVAEVENVYVGRTYGESKMDMKIVLEGLKVPFLLRMRHLLGRS